MNITNEERQVIILRRLELLRNVLGIAMSEFDHSTPGGVAREKLRVKLAEIADGLGEACD